MIVGLLIVGPIGNPAIWILHVQFYWYQCGCGASDNKQDNYEEVNVQQIHQSCGDGHGSAQFLWPVLLWRWRAGDYFHPLINWCSQYWFLEIYFFLKTWRFSRVKIWCWLATPFDRKAHSPPGSSGWTREVSNWGRIDGGACGGSSLYIIFRI